MSTGVSIVICTHNGAARIGETLRYIALQKVPAAIAWEVIVIDNNSSDDTVPVARRAWQQYAAHVPFRIIEQPVPGLTAARRMGFATALYEYVLLCDDDNWLAPDYVAHASTVMSANNNVGILGGHGKLAFGETPPAWLQHLNLLAAGPQAPATGKVARNIVYGAGCVVRKTAYEKILQTGFEFMLTDRNGAMLTSGGDHELCYAIALAGYDIWYDERLQFTHFITKDRLSWDYFLKYVQESSYCFYVLEPYKILLNMRSYTVLQFRLQLLRTYIYLLRKVIRVFIKRARVAPDTDYYKALTLRLIILKARLVFYSNYSIMHNTFRKVTALKKKLDQVTP